MNRLIDFVLRARIRAQLYVGIAFAVTLTLSASLVAWVSFNRVGDAQRVVNERSVADIASSFAVAQEAQALAGAAPRLTIAPSREDLARVRDEIDGQLADFLERVGELAGQGERGGSASRIRARGREMTAVLESIEESAAQQFDLAERSSALRDALRSVEARLSTRLVTAIDDQFFYALTGYRQLGREPDPREAHFTRAEVNKYRRLAELQEAAAIGTQVLANAFSLADDAQLEPLRERFEAFSGRVERNLEALRAEPIVDEIEPLFQELISLSVREEGVFDMRERELALVARQNNLLASNRAIAIDLVAEVEGQVSGAQSSAREATLASEEAISTGRRLLLALNVVSVIGAALIAWGFVGKVLLRRLELLSTRMREMAAGDLETKVEIKGSDEVAEMGASLEVFRRHALEVQRLNLVEKLADELKGKNEKLETVLEDLRHAQGQIVMREKLAALGELTAGVAHEIKNPLNFIKNFSEVSAELIEELTEALPAKDAPLTGDSREEVEEICQDLTENLATILSHSQRANRIVHDMLQMGRDAGDRYAVDINLLVKEHAGLAYHSARATDSNFQLDIQEDFDPDMGEIEVIPQELGRVILNLVGNACHATDDKRKASGSDYAPTVTLATRRAESRAEIRVRDNGKGMPLDVQEKIFNPFFTTKPTNQGTGLGLSLSSDIVRKHGGEIRVESREGEYTEMVIDLPLGHTPEAEAGEPEAEADAAAA